MDQGTQEMSTGTYNILYGIKLAVGLVLVALTASWISKYQNGFGWSSDANKQFNWHPFLMILGLVFLYSQSILVYRTGRYTITKKNMKYIHAGIHLAAFLATVVGLKAAFESHRRNGYEHLYSVHSWLGLLTVIIFAAQFLSGFFAFLYPGLPGYIRKLIMPHHVFFGTIAFIMAVITSVAGITEMAMFTIGYSDLLPVSYYLNFMGLFTVLYGVLTIYLLIKPEFKRIPLAHD